MDINITTVCEVNEKKLLERLKKSGIIECDNIRTTLEIAISDTIQSVLKQHVEDDVLTIVLSTVPACPYIDNSTECSVNYVSGTYLIRGDNELCRDLRSKIGSKVVQSSEIPSH